LGEVIIILREEGNNCIYLDLLYRRISYSMWDYHAPPILIGPTQYFPLFCGLFGQQLECTCALNI